NVGNVWEYERWADECEPEPPFCDPVPNGFLRREVVRDTVFDSGPAWVVRDSRYSTGGHPSYQVETIVRYDSAQARAYEFRFDGSPWGYWPDGIPCPLDAPFWGETDC